VVALVCAAWALLAQHVATEDAHPLNRALQHLSETMQRNEAKIDILRERLP
jgi:hypothetical protein